MRARKRRGGASFTPADPYSNNPVTVARDGSVGDTYTAPAGWTGLQWYRVALAAPNTATVIGGATAGTYVAQAADEGYRLAVQGDDGGTLKRIPARQIVTPAPVLIDGMEALTSYANTGSPVTSLDPVNKVEGASSLVVQPTGTGYRVIRTVGALPVPATADLGTLAFMGEALNADAGFAKGAGLRFARTGATPSSTTLFGATGFAQPPHGRFWSAQHVTEVPDILAGDPALSWRWDFDQSSASNAPYANDMRLDAFVAKAQGRGTVVLTFDDAMATQYTVALPELQARGFKGTWFLPTDIVAAGTGASRLSVAQAQALAAAGMDMQLDGTADDAAMVTKHADPAAALAELLAMRAQLAAWGLNDNARHFCYPNGLSYINPRYAADPVSGLGVEHRVVTNLSVTSTGTAVVTATATTGILAGMSVGGYQVPAGTTVVSVDSATQLTLSNAIPAQTKPMSFWDGSGPFFINKLQSALAAAGTFKLGRTTQQEAILTRFGFADRGLLMPGVSLSNGATGSYTDAQLAANALAKVDLAILRGATVVFYIHGIEPGATFITTPTDTFTQFMDGLTTRRDAGTLDVLTLDQLWQRDGACSFPG